MRVRERLRERGSGVGERGWERKERESEREDDTCKWLGE